RIQISLALIKRIPSLFPPSSWHPVSSSNHHLIRHPAPAAPFATMDQQQYCLKWSNYSSNLAAAFSNLFDSATLTDVTLVCGGECQMDFFKGGNLKFTE
ncbi:hypothetical protein pipiens_004526, partial [Culex pipiens pipiens]